MLSKTHTHLAQFCCTNVNRYVNFVIADTRVHTQTIELTRLEVRGTVPQYGNKKHHLVVQIAEFIFRHINPDYNSRINALFRAIEHLYSYNDEDDINSPTPSEPGSNVSSSLKTTS